MDEAAQISETEPLRQGDLLLGHQISGVRHRKRWVVLTADCDLAQGKTQGMLTAAPVLSLDQYITEDWCAEQMRDLRDQINARLTQVFNHHMRERNENHVDVKADFILEWLAEDGNDALAAAIGLSGREADAFNAVCSCAQQCCFNPAHDLSIENWIDFLHDMRFEAGLVQARTKARARRNDIKNALKAFGIDTFQFNVCPPSDGLGWIVRLRGFTNLKISDVVRTRKLWFSHPHYLLRTARLAPPFKFALGQQFAALFSRIGFPDEFNRLKDLVIEDACVRNYSKET